MLLSTNKVNERVSGKSLKQIWTRHIVSVLSFLFYLTLEIDFTTNGTNALRINVVDT